MDDFDKVKQNRYNIMFFSLKILALFFCASPLFQYFFKDTTAQTLDNINFPATLISLGIILVIMFMWIVMDYNRKKMRFALLIEIAVFYTVCISSIILSGADESYYKFLFIFMIVSYTIEFGIKTGIIIAIVSSFTLLGMDLLLFKQHGVNPFFQSDIALSAMFIVVAWILGFYVRMEKKHIEELKNYANVDGLTEIYNHRYFHEIFKIKCDESIENNKPISMIMLDIDYFKSYNDMYGHQQGDQVLKEMAVLIKANIRENDIACRYGGEEFAIILLDTTQDEAIKIAEELRTVIYNYDFLGEELMPNGNLSVSIGISQLMDNNDSTVNIINRADAALYRAKFFRKNRVEIYSSVFDQFRHLDKNIDDSLTSIKTLITIINSRDRYTYNHIERVVYFCEIFANYLKLSSEEKRRFIYGAYLHDLGKINVSKKTLISDKKLTPEEWEEMKKHPSDSADIVKQIGDLEDIAEIVLQHHEKYDGSGYPSGLRGEEINYLARMLTIADSFDAMTNKRPYQDKKSYEDAFEEIRACKGTHFDPDLSELFIKAINESV